MIEDVTGRFKECRDLLVAQRAPLVSAIAEARAAEAQATGLLKHLDQALAALDGDRRRGATKKKRQPEVNRRECSTKPEVRQLIAECRSNFPAASSGRLKEEVATRLQERGRSLSMFSKLFADCLGEEAAVDRSAETTPRTSSDSTQAREATQ